MSGWSIVILGLSITSSWGNGHATTWRSLVRGLVSRGHEVLFLERDVPWYAASRDRGEPRHGRLALYQDLEALRRVHRANVRDADLVLVGSFVPDGIEVLRWVLDTSKGVVGFYDIDTPVTLDKLERKDRAYLSPELIPELNIYFSFTGGPVLQRIERNFGARLARPLYCAVDPDVHRPERTLRPYEIGYLGTFCDDRQPKLEQLLLAPARCRHDRRFVVAGSQYPSGIRWPANVARIHHVPPCRHAAFYGSQRYTLNITRDQMTACGWSPSVRLFEAAACGTPIISDLWPGLDDVLDPGREVLVAQSTADVLRLLAEVGETERERLAAAARERVLAQHTGIHRAAELEHAVAEARRRRAVECVSVTSTAPVVAVRNRGRCDAHHRPLD